MIGIDFGTSTTEVAVVVEGTASLLAGPGGDTIIPSVVAYPPVGTALVGAEADARWRIDLENTIHSVKRIVGRRWYDQEVAEFRESCGYTLVRGESHAVEIETRAGLLSPEAVAETLLRKILSTMDLPKNVPATIGAPPSFGPEQRLALVEIATQAGLSRVTTADEPYAAILPYLRREEGQKKVVVYDLGGGTFDVAVLEVRGKVHRILACDGDPFLGGNDIDRALAEWARGRILVERHWDLRASSESWTALIGVCREAKQRLSRLPRTPLALGLTDPAVADHTLQIDRDVLVTATRELMGRTFAICDHVLREAGLRAAEVDEVILSGGSTFLPMIRDSVGRYFDKDPISSLPANQLVALGSALAASARA